MNGSSWERPLLRGGEGNQRKFFGEAGWEEWEEWELWEEWEIWDFTHGGLSFFSSFLGLCMI